MQEMGDDRARTGIPERIGVKFSKNRALYKKLYHREWMRLKRADPVWRAKEYYDEKLNRFYRQERKA